MTTSELWRWNARDLARAIARREVSAREAAQSHLARLEAVDPTINAVVLTLADEALAAADAADRAAVYKPTVWLSNRAQQRGQPCRGPSSRRFIASTRARCDAF
ncbi:MAG: hypothetical protein JSR60_20410 [Proteobacteria bacterium]|nr:hypothetical protein [Pseudomonadota bacterium]